MDIEIVITFKMLLIYSVALCLLCGGMGAWWGADNGAHGHHDGGDADPPTPPGEVVENIPPSRGRLPDGWAFVYDSNTREVIDIINTRSEL